MKVRRIAAGLLLAAATLVTGVVTAAPGASAHTLPARTVSAKTSALIVKTDKGLIAGTYAEGTDQFLGVPYAAPPAGALRWAAPQPAASWAGVRQATSYGGRCAQLASGNGPRVDNEDCLYLNVYTPPGQGGKSGPGRRSVGHGLPVLVMIHGGGLTTGAGDQHDGSLIVTTDHIIVVSVNYRLGPFGFLDLPGLG